MDEKPSVETPSRVSNGWPVMGDIVVMISLLIVEFRQKMLSGNTVIGEFASSL